MKCDRCGGEHFGSYKCPYLDRAVCASCGTFIPAEVGNAYDVHPGRRFDALGRVYHATCKDDAPEPELRCRKPSYAELEAELSRLRTRLADLEGAQTWQPIEDRDRVWCMALLSGDLSLDHVHAVLKRFNELRPDGKPVVLPLPSPPTQETP